MIFQRFPGERFDHMDRAQLLKMFEDFAVPKVQRSTHRQSQQKMATDNCLSLHKNGPNRKRTYDMTTNGKDFGSNETNETNKVIRLTDQNGLSNGNFPTSNGLRSSNSLKRPAVKVRRVGFLYLSRFCPLYLNSGN